MLIDFSEHLRTNLYLLGSTFMRLVQTLKIRDLPLVDPMLYIVRFASKLEFEERTPDVIRDATRLVSRMERDWIVKGRKPAGICAACIFIAARMNGFTRTASEIVHVVKICETTLHKRLDDFNQTPSSQLSVDDFQNLMLESSMDPPSFMNDRKRKIMEVERKRKREVAVKRAEKEKEREKVAAAKGKGKGKAGEGEEEVADSGVVVEKEVEVALDEEEAEIEEDMQGTLESESFKKLVASFGVNMEALDEDLSLLDDDIEVDECLLTEQEIEIKKMFWEAENKEWERDKMVAEAKPVAKKPRKKRGPSSNAGGPSFGAASSAHEAGMNFMASKPSLSKKINYDVIGNLFNEDPSEASFDGADAARPGQYASGSVTGFGLVGVE
ncbi:transcription factor TFIIIB subunit brf1 [Podochytrium sp. JEL0797]|nr:transcription factor TFIIIB subunit brf1 [Podochytrium sp. JEL0797]